MNRRQAYPLFEIPTIMTLPPQYSGYFNGDGMKEGALCVEPGWFQLWPPDEVERWNREYQVQEFAPGFLGFGSSGGGEMLAFDAGGRVVMIDPDALDVFLGGRPIECS